jgi:NADPH:quinone reductase
MATAKAMRVYKSGGPDVLQWENFDPGSPGAGQVRVRHTAIGLNFIDIYHRTGLYPLPFPHGLGLEAAGIVEAAGPDVKSPRVGDRVAYTTGPAGAYADINLVPADRLVVLPEDIDDRTAAALMMKGLTAWYLLHKTFAVKRGHTILVHAAAGGVGQVLSRWGKALGAKIIGTVGSAEKVSIAREAGCDHVLISRQDFVKEVRDITGGAGVDVVYDGIGKDTFMASLDCLKPRGLMASYGSASGPVPPFEPGILSAKGSLFLTRPSLMHYTATRAELEEGAGALFDAVRKKIVRATVTATFALKDAAEAQRQLESRRTTGTVLLIP